MLRFCLALALAIAGFARCGLCSVLTVGRGLHFSTLTTAVAAARAGDEIDIEAGTYDGDGVVISVPLTLIGVHGRPVLQSSGFIGNGKAILVTRADITVRNIAFRNAAVDSGNGAGIRHERGDLTVEDCLFGNDQNGVLVAESPASTVVIRHSEFVSNGAGDGHTHGLYVGSEIATLVVEHCVFLDTHVGHHLKSRARRTVVTDSSFGDGLAGTNSYDTDFPNGGVVVISHNKLSRGSGAENRALVNYGGEGLQYQANSLLVEDNEFTNHGSWFAIAVRNRSAVSAALVGNRFESIFVRLMGPGSIK